MKQYRRVLTIAGSDSGGGAGIQADLKAISACGCYAMSAITALTAQNTLGVKAIHSVPPEMVVAQMEAVLTDIGVDTVKLGMLPSAEMIRAIAETLKRFEVKHIVLDPVMVSTSGCQLISTEAAEAICTHLFPIADLITPNLPEAEYLTRGKIATEEDFPAAAIRLQQLGASAVLLKAGHLQSQKLTDYLFDREGKISCYRYDKIDTPNTHGTGCTLSSSIAAYLAWGYPLSEAVALAEDYLHKALLNGREYQIGGGHGPVHHFFKFWNE